ncbi:unnamed protein product [Mytilus coruscus]|uniref:Uncharacterized protein n=1 Tax=Mytilus coruscus TaxID=42192 RepID=A0A6J8BTM8_MYTCO|nr:unnamed protein product [Mytilus coruscus]
MKLYHVGAPMERVALDMIEPFPLSKKGHKYAFTVSDYFTRHCSTEYLAKEKLITNVRNKQPKTIVEYQLKAIDNRKNGRKPRPNPTFVIPVSPMKKAPMVQILEKTPEKSRCFCGGACSGTCLMDFSPIKSPVPVTPGFEDDVIPPLSEELLALFNSPHKPV